MRRIGCRTPRVPRSASPRAQPRARRAATCGGAHPTAVVGDELAGDEPAGPVEERRAQRCALFDGAEAPHRDAGLDLGPDVRVVRAVGPNELGEVHEVRPDGIDLYAMAGDLLRD